MDNITLGDYNYLCTDLNASFIGNLVQNETANGTVHGTVDLVVLVEHCNNTCQLAWGSPNPDLSGIGTVISYMMQAVLIALFGLYLIIPGFLHRLGFQYPERIHRNFRAANLLLAVSFFVAEVSHLLQAPGLVEKNFMRMLAEMQIMQYSIMAYGVVAALGCFGQTTSFLTASQLLRGGDNWRLLDLAPPALSVVYLALDTSHYGDPSAWQEAVVRLETCRLSEPGQRDVAAVQQGKFQLSCSDVEDRVTIWLFYAYAVSMGVQLVCGSTFAVCWYGAKWVAPAGATPTFRLHVTRHKWWYRFLPKLGLVLCILLTAAMVIAVWIYRFCVDSQVDANAQQDNQWSIGQVLAPAAWVPSILDIATWMYGCFRGRRHPEDEGKSHAGTQDLCASPSHSGTTSPPPREGTGAEAKGLWV